MPSWSARDLENAITALMNAVAAATEGENDPNIPTHIRELFSDIRTNARIALMLNREIRSAHEEALNGKAENKAARR